MKDKFLGIFKKRGMLPVMLCLALGIMLIFLGTEEDGGTAVAAGTEDSIAAILSEIDGVGECRVLISYETAGASWGSSGREVISGIVVVCEGGSSDAVKRRVTEALSSLYGIGTNRIKVEKLR